MSDALGELYRLYAATGELLYVGASRAGVMSRIKSTHQRRQWWPLVDRIDIERVPLEELAARERDAIADERPAFNVKGADPSYEARQISRIDQAAQADKQRAYRDRRRGGPPRQPKPCGTLAAVRRHQRRGEPLDAACREAYNAAHRAMYRKRTGTRGT